MATLSMDKFAEERNMDQFSEKPAAGHDGRPSKFFWRWHYRAAKAQEMYVTMIDCWVDQNYAGEAQRVAKRRAEKARFRYTQTFSLPTLKSF